MEDAATGSFPTTSRLVDMEAEGGGCGWEYILFNFSPEPRLFTRPAAHQQFLAPSSHFGVPGRVVLSPV